MTLDRIVVSLINDRHCRQISQILQSAGIQVRHCCKSGAETIREILNMGSGIVICGSKLSDMTPQDLANELKGRALLLIIASPAQLEYFGPEDIIKLSPPVARRQLITAVATLKEEEARRFRETVLQRGPEDDALIDRAKTMMMDRERISEQEAHRFLQQRSMSSGMRKTELARRIIEAYHRQEQERLHPDSEQEDNDAST